MITRDQLPTMTGLSFKSPVAQEPRVTAIIWGQVGTGKTPLAITAPPPILYILFDIDGSRSVAHVGDRYMLLDLTGEPISIVDQFMSTKTIFYQDLCKQLATGYYKTVVFDSLTAFLEKALIRGIDLIAPTVTKGIKPTLLQPQLSGYGARGTLMRMCAATLHEATAKYNVSLVFTAHEAIVYEKNDQGQSEPAGYTMMLPGEAAVQIPKNISEIWCLRDYNGERRIYVRSWNKWSPMRTRMFVGTEPFFPWKFDADKWEGQGIEQWLELSKKAEGKKIPYPK